MGRYYDATAPTPLARLRRTEHAGAEMQPWRCAGCNTAVRMGFQDPCRCIPNPDPRDPVSNRDPKTLFTFTDLRSKKTYEITSVEGYGITCPNLWTTNGSAYYVSQLLFDGAAHDFFVLPEGWRFKSAKDLTEALIEAHRAAWGS